uniref:hypothetical protein n=1 Tax=Backusella lamprospora TaxID=64654 RepID=UPI002E75D3FE|nr:hypothetical protein V2394_mgp17 [Backusella lamprospora]WPR14061.1 hypothetical protein [Backusella lamprospora]
MIGLVSRYLTNYLIYSIGTSIGGNYPFNIWYSTNPMGSLPIHYSPVRHVQTQVFGIRLACVKSLDSIHSKLSLNFYLLFWFGKIHDLLFRSSLLIYNIIRQDRKYQKLKSYLLLISY